MLVRGALQALRNPGAGAAGLDTPALFHEALSDEMRLPEPRRLELYEWCTGRAAVPTGGLKDKIRLRHYEVDDTNTLPECHTWCAAKLA